MSRFDRPSHRVYMGFFCRDGWNIQFLEADLKTPLPRKLNLADPDKIRDLPRHGWFRVVSWTGRCEEIDLAEI
jgi:hypothetical protein